MSTRGSMVLGGETINWRESPAQEIGVSFSDPTTKREWLFDGSLNSDKIETAVASVIPAIDVRGGVSRFYDGHSLKEKGGGAWHVPVMYRGKPAYWELSINTTGGRAKMMQSIRTVRAYDLAGNRTGTAPEEAISLGLVPDFKRAIGVNGSSVDGCEITIPAFNFSINYKFKISTLSAAYLMTLYRLTGRANHAPYTLSWKGQTLTFARGDVHFLGSPCKQTSDDQLDITFNFSASKGQAGGARSAASFLTPAVGGSVTVEVSYTGLFSVGTNIYIVGAGRYQVTAIDAGAYTITVQNLGVGADLVTPNTASGTTIASGTLISADEWEEDPIAIGDGDPIRREGWEYIWTRYQESNDPATGSLTRKPIAAYIEQVLKYGNLNLLGIS